MFIVSLVNLPATPDMTGYNKKSVESLLARHAHFEAFAMPFPNHNKQLEVHAEYANCLYGRYSNYTHPEDIHCYLARFGKLKVAKFQNDRHKASINAF